MKNKEENPSEEIRLPELEIHGRWEIIIKWSSHIRPMYWLVSTAALLGLFLTFMPYDLWLYIWTNLVGKGKIVIMILFFSLVALSLLWSVGQRIDVWVFMYFNMHGRRAPWFDGVMLAFTQIGNGIFAMATAVLLFFRVDHLLAYEIALGTLTLWLVVELLKVMIHRTRPYIKLNNIRIVGSLASGRSFPSGHTSQSFFMATLLSHYYQVDIIVWLGLYAIALLVGITRIYVGMHYPRDVIGGAILGTAWGLLGVIVNSSIWGIVG